ncbi:MAG: ComEC/Rec2 family competence protein, partial [Firmicutes bacterium]|nr:ComEC/Rec2 family competence protein [Bacillota bacterium]
MIAICIIAASIFVKKGNVASGLVESKTEKKKEYGGRLNENTKSTFISLVLFLQLGIILFTSAASGIERDLERVLSDSGGKVSGVITEVDVKQDYVAFVLYCRADESSEILESSLLQRVGIEKGNHYSILVSVYGDNIGLDNPGDAARFEGCEAVFYGKPEEPKGQRNPHCFDYKKYLSTKGICATVSAKTYEIGEVKRPIRHKFAMWKAEFTDELTQFSGSECAGLISGILFGEKGGIDDETYDMFKKNGTAHILAVSGLHIGIVYGFAVSLMRRRKTRKSRLFAAAFVMLYIAIAGFTPSVTRAGAMILLHILSKEWHMRYDMLSAAAGVCIANLIINPLMLWNTGFQLSYLAIFTICFVTHRFCSGDAKAKGLKQALIGSFAVQLGIAPFTAFQFNYFSLVSIILNIPVIFIAGLLVPLAIAMLYALGIVAILPGIDFASVSRLFEFGTFILEKLGGTLVKLNDLAFMGGHSHFVCTSPPVWALVLYYGLLFFLCSEGGFIMFARHNIKKIT